MKTNISVGLMAFAAAGLTVPVWVQAAIPEDAGRVRPAPAMEEVVVTAQKREEKLQDVPIAISVIGGESLDKSTLQDATEALSRVPGVTINQMFLGGASQVTVRGVAVGQAINGGASTTAYYLDSVPFGFTKSAVGPDPDVYDLSRIEVLRGPQGTLYGANALNGVVRILSNEADLDNLQFKVRTGASVTESDENYRGDAAVNVPIVAGKLAVRAVAGYQNLSGWIDKPTKADANDAEIQSMRLQVRAQPTDEFSVSATGWFSRADYGAPNFGYENGRSASVIDEPVSTDYDAYNLKVGYEFPLFSVTSMTSYVNYENSLTYDRQLAQRTLNSYIKAETFAEEVLINSRHAGPWRWSLGGMYRDSEDDRLVAIPGSFPAPDLLTNTSESYAAFGELTRALLDGRLEVTGGLRYFEDEVGLHEHSRLALAQPATYVNRVKKFNATTGRVVLNWHPSEESTLYASYAEGFRSGMHQVPTVVPLLATPEVDPDSLENYELGAKATLFDGRLSVDSAVYFIDWQDVQRQVGVVGPNAVVFTGLVNGESASGMGVDLGFVARATDGLELGISFSWNDLTTDEAILSGGVPLFDKGDRLDNSPEYTVSASLDYAIGLGTTGLECQFSVSGNYTSEQSVRGLVAGRRVIRTADEMTIARASFSVSTPRSWIATLYVDNATNEDGSPVRHATDPFRDIQLRPRTVGLQLQYSY